MTEPKPKKKFARAMRLTSLPAGEMNKTEAAYARHLEKRRAAGEILSFFFEPAKWRIGKNCQYSPDFMVISADGEVQFHEVKGKKIIFRDDAKVKVRAAASKYPFRFLVAFPKPACGWDIEDWSEGGTNDGS